MTPLPEPTCKHDTKRKCQVDHYDSFTYNLVQP